MQSTRSSLRNTDIAIIWKTELKETICKTLYL